ncbi:MAG TPA: undecaprenyldiphospho-muramoylpentapeptide beta-N-acetylglucosaminyltransferase [Patescibacteria group bacterium]|nr:undecaprenyldiphospho-muramoylpentapeptide beta-N-acetylglucosaminyltransferase [Patescibacteria group bacterium]
MRILVAAGGTGGHLFPAIAVVEELEHITGKKCTAEFFGSQGKIETRVVPELGYKIHILPIKGVSNLKSIQGAIFFAKLFASFFECRDVIADFKPDVILCTGAYLSYPVGLAARFQKAPLVLMESNVFPGKAIRALAGIAKKIIVSFEGSREYFSKNEQDKIEVLGNPVRSGIRATPDKTEARGFFGLKPDVPTVLAVGGSLGAKSINEALEKIVKKPGSPFKNIQLIWQTGSTFQSSGDFGENIWVNQFIKDMPHAYAAADLVIARAGATTLAELSAIGKPSILVPYPFAANNHQEHNARYMEEKGASRMILDKDMQLQLENEVLELLENESELLRMSVAARSLGKPEAATQAAEVILSLTKK